jgi:hypothetical protein
MKSTSLPRGARFSLGGGDPEAPDASLTAVSDAQRSPVDVPDAEVHVLDAGHFALDTAADRIAQLVGDFINSERR